MLFKLGTPGGHAAHHAVIFNYLESENRNRTEKSSELPYTTFKSQITFYISLLYLIVQCDFLPGIQLS